VYPERIPPTDELVRGEGWKWVEIMPDFTQKLV